MNAFQVDRAEVRRLCALFGSILQPHLSAAIDSAGKPLDGPALLWAIAGNESTFGENCTPRFEPAYAPGGRYFAGSEALQQAFALYGRDASCSFGPWQILAVNAAGFTPEELGTDPEKAAAATVGYIQRYVIGARAAKTLEQILDTYNSGTWRDEQTAGVARYVHDGLAHYAEWDVSAVVTA